MQFTVTMSIDKDTKRTVRYEEDTTADGDQVIRFPMIYIQKSALPTPYPKTIKVTVEADDG